MVVEVISLERKIQRKIARQIIHNTIRHLIYFREHCKEKTLYYLKGFLFAFWKADLLSTKNRNKYQDYIIKKF